MIIWIDGTYGSGKTRISNILNEKIEESVLLSADYFNKYIWNPMVEKNPILKFGVIGHGNKKFLCGFKDYLNSKLDDKAIYIIDICLLNDNGKSIIYDEFNCAKDKHIILNISYDTLVHRMEKCDREDKQLPFSFYHEYTIYINNYTDALVIDNNDVNVDLVVDKCLEYIFD